MACTGTRATIYALDERTGQELWSSGDQIHEWNPSRASVANGRVYLSTYDDTLYCFGVDAPDARAITHHRSSWRVR